MRALLGFTCKRFSDQPCKPFRSEVLGKDKDFWVEHIFRVPDGPGREKESKSTRSSSPTRS